MSTPAKHLGRTNAESSRVGWLGFFFGESDRQRWFIALAFAIFFHSIAAGFVHSPMAQPTPEREIVANVVALKIEKRPKPTPSPTPRPIPTPVPHTRVIADTSITPHKIDPGASAHKENIVKAGSSRPTTKTKYHSKPIWDIPVGGQGAGAGKSGTVGSLGHGGTGTGQGSHGAGAGGGGTQPCGAVTFSNPRGSDYDKSTGGFYVDIRLTVSFPDRHTEGLILDYPFYYRSEAANPFSEANVRDHPDMEIPFQFPPRALRANEPPLVQYVMTHTTNGGFTELNNCP